MIFHLCILTLLIKFMLISMKIRFHLSGPRFDSSFKLLLEVPPQSGQVTVFSGRAAYPRVVRTDDPRTFMSEARDSAEQ